MWVSMQKELVSKKKGLENCKNMKKKGFTLIELLVVVAIIALLLSIIIPALGSAKKLAQRVVCRTNLHQWGLAITLYHTDNGKLLSTVNTWGAGQEGLIAWSSDAMIAAHPGEFNLKSIDGYLKGFDYTTHELGETWVCPSNNVDIVGYQKAMWSAIGFVVMHYSYWGRVDLWPDKATHPDQLIGKDLVSTKILMTDTCFRLGGAGNGYLYNHGKNGASVHHPSPLLKGPIDQGPPEITGINRCYGDGHVEWNPESEYDTYLMNDWGDRTQPRALSGNNSFY